MTSPHRKTTHGKTTHRKVAPHSRVRAQSRAKLRKWSGKVTRHSVVPGQFGFEQNPVRVGVRAERIGVAIERCLEHAIAAKVLR